MATIDFTSEQAKLGFGANKPMWIEKEVSFAKKAAAATDTLKLFKLPIYTRILKFITQITTAEAGNITFGTLVGATADVTGLDATVQMNCAAGTLKYSKEGCDGKLFYRMVCTDNWITGTTDCTMTTGVFRVGALIVQDTDH